MAKKPKPKAKGKSKNWIAGAIKKPGAFTKQAAMAGESVSEFAQEKAGAPGKTGQRARLALTLAKLRKGKAKPKK